MNLRFGAAWLAGMVTMAVVGGFLYGVVFASYFEANITTDVMKEPELVWVGLAHVPFALLLTLVVSWRDATSAREGAVTGAILGFLMAAGYDLSQYGTTTLWSLELTLVEPFISMVLVAAAGSVVGALLPASPQNA